MPETVIHEWVKVQTDSKSFSRLFALKVFSFIQKLGISDKLAHSTVGSALQF